MEQQVNHERKFKSIKVYMLFIKNDVLTDILLHQHLNL